MLLSAGRVWRRVITVAAITAMFLVVFQPAAQAVSCTNHAYIPFLNANDKVQAHVIANCSSTVNQIHVVGQIWRVLSGPDVKIAEIIKNCYSNNVCDVWPIGSCAQGSHGYYSKARGWFKVSSGSSQVTIPADGSDTNGIAC